MITSTVAGSNATRPALITGGGRNIGAQIARDLAELGHPVVLCARRTDEIVAVAREIRSSGDQALATVADVTNPAEVTDVFNQATEQFGTPIQIVINNAVVRAQKPIDDMELDEFQHVLDVVLSGSFTTIQHALPAMRAHKWGRIINFAGVAGESGASNRAGIVAAKSGIIGLTKAVALETASDGITCNAISPGIINTTRDEQHLQSMGDRDLAKKHYTDETEHIPVGRQGTTAEVSAACRYLVSSNSGFVTGQVLRVNGGRYM